MSTSSSITKGKGWQGPVKRFGVAKLWHKTTAEDKARRSTRPGKRPERCSSPCRRPGSWDSTTGPSTTSAYLRSENSSDRDNPELAASPTTVSSRTNTCSWRGSIPGPAKRLVRIRKAVRNAQAAKEPKISYISEMTSW